MTYAEQIDKILKEFDFERVHETMKALKWRWYYTGNEAPSIEQLKTSARRQLEQCILEKGKENWYVYGSGGFECEWLYGSLSLKFVLTETIVNENGLYE